MEKLTSEQFKQLYKKLPDELKDALFSIKTINTAVSIQEKYKITDEQYPDFFDAISQVLLGLLPPAELRETLEKELDIDPETAKKISREVNRYIFYPLKNSLEDLYNMELIKPIKPAFAASKTPFGREIEEPEKLEELDDLENPEEESQKPKESKGPDVYQEPVE